MNENSKVIVHLKFIIIFSFEITKKKLTGNGIIHLLYELTVLLSTFNMEVII